MQEKRKVSKGILIHKEEITLSLLGHNIIVYVENPEESTKNLLKIIKWL